MDVRILKGDARTVLAGEPEKSVHCCITSPPYWKLRQYDKGNPLEIGQEDDPWVHINQLLQVFSGVWRVLRDDGLLFLNYGDSYVSKSFSPNFKSKDLISIPFMLAQSLRNQGWYHRSTIIWAKKSPMPNSVCGTRWVEENGERVLKMNAGRPTTSHEYVFMFSKSPSYFYNQDGNRVGDSGRNLWTIWDDIRQSNFKGLHYAPMPLDLARRCIKLATSEIGCCPTCGAQWAPLVESKRVPTRPAKANKRVGGPGNVDPERHVTTVKILDWLPACDCGKTAVSPLVLDPFSGSGTSGEAAIECGCRYLGVELNEEYVDMSQARLEQTNLF